MAKDYKPNLQLPPKNVQRKLKKAPALIFSIPSEDEEGYLERMIAVGGFSEMIETNKITRQGFEDMVRFLADYVREPADLEKRIELLRKASERQIKELLLALSNSGQVDPTNGGSSDAP